MIRFFRSTAYRVAIIYSLAFALAVAMLGAVLYFSFNATLLDQLDSRNANEMAELVNEYNNHGLTGLEQAIDRSERARRQPDDPNFALFNAAGNRIAGKLNTRLPKPGTRDIIFLDPVEGPDPGRAEVLALGDGHTLVVGADLGLVERVDDLMLSLLGIALGAVVVIGIGGALILGFCLQRRLGRMSAAAREIMAGDMSRRMALSSADDEFDRLSATLNDMLDRILALMDNLRQVSSDIAHDLRTPLVRLRSSLERSLAEDKDIAIRRSEIERALGQTDQILGLFAAILRISEIESQRLKQSFVTFGLSDLMEELCQSFAPVIEEGGQGLKWRVEPDISIEGDRELMAQLLINLLENAQKHTPRGTLIEVRLEAKSPLIMLTVMDNGPGVDIADHSRITKKFIRLEAARSTPGNGLGLNLVAAIATLHQASLNFEDNRPGLRVVVQFITGVRP